MQPDQARYFVGPELGPDCLQRLSAAKEGLLVLKDFVGFCTKFYPRKFSLKIISGSNNKKLFANFKF